MRINFRSLTKKLISNLKPIFSSPKNLVVPVFTLAYLTVLIFYSQRFGRLTHELSYDDVSYAVSSAQRLNILESKGWIALFQSYFNNPPHSPTTEFFGTVGLFIFGRNDTAFYAGQTLNILIVLIFIFFLFKEKYSRARKSMTLFLVVFCSPLVIMLALDARPDMFNGCMTALTCLTILSAAKISRESTYSFKKYMWLIATGGALSLVSKLTIMPQTLTLLFFCCLISVGLVEQKKRSDFSKMIISSFGISILISSPILVLSFTRILSYIHDAAFSTQRSIWNFSQTESNFEIAKILLSSSWQRIGGIVTPSYLLLLCGGLLLLKRKISLAVHFSFLVLMLISFFILLTVRQKNEFFFSSIHAFALFGLIELLLQIYSVNYKKIALSIALIVAISSLLLTSQFVRFPKSMETKIPSGINREIIRTISEETPEKILSNVFVAFTGPVNATTLNWYEMQINGTRTFVDDALNSNFNEVLSRAKNFDLVLVVDSFRNDAAEGLPSSDFQNNITAALLNSGYGFAQKFPAEAPHYYLLKRDEPSKFEVFIDNNDLGGIDGPFPDRGIFERFRWSKSNEILFCMEKLSAGVVDYEIPLMTELAQELTITSDTFNQTFPHTPGVFQFDKVTVSAGVGTKCLKISVPAKYGRVAISVSFFPDTGVVRGSK